MSRWGVVVTVIALALGGAGDTRAAELGAATDLTWGISRPEVDKTVAMMRAAGVRTVRLNVSWTGTHPRSGGVVNRGYLETVDYALESVRAARIAVVLQLGDSVPAWVPAAAAWGDYARFVRLVVDRYKDEGISGYEVWNEPNHRRFWPFSAPRTDYVEMLRAGALAIRAGDPRATVVLGGLSRNDHLYLEELYDKGARASFDVVAVHPYTGAVDPNLCWNQAGTAERAKDAFCGIEQIRRTMIANGDKSKRIWLTEFGWSTYDGEYGVTEAQQARYLRTAARRLERYPYVSKALWYAFRDRPLREDLDAQYGLLRADFSPKAAYATFRQLARKKKRVRIAAQRPRAAR